MENGSAKGMDREASISFAKKYLEDLLSFFGLNTEITVHCSDDVIELIVPSTHLNGFLIGQSGETLRSLQFLLSTTLKNAEAELTRVNIDIANYKRHRAERLAEQVNEWCKQVQASGEPMNLRPMNAVDRRTVHQVITDYSELQSESQGEGRDRHIIISKVK